MVAPRSSGMPSSLDAPGELAAAGVGAQVGHRDDAHAGGVQRERRVQAAVARGGHDRVAARADAVERGQPDRAAGQHHARQVVVGEHERLLDQPGGGHVPRRADLVQRVALPDGHETVEVAQRGGAREHLHARLAHERGQLAGALVAAFVQERAAGL